MTEPASPTDDARFISAELPPEIGGGVIRRLRGAALKSLGIPEEELRRLHRPFLLEEGGSRHLCFSIETSQTTMHVEDPYSLASPYTRKMMSFLLFDLQPRRVLMIGLGGGALAKFCYRHLPEATLTVVELDPEVIALRDEFFIPPDDHRLRVIRGDGAAYLARTTGEFDVILVDAFDAHGVAMSLTEPAPFVAAAARLSAEGVLVMNFAGDRSRYAPALDGLKSAFGGRVGALSVPTGDNLVVFACRSNARLLRGRTAVARARELGAQTSVDFPRFLRRLERRIAFREAPDPC